MSYTDNPKIDLQQVEEDRLSFPKQLFEQEYNAEFTEGMSGVFGDFKSLLKITQWIEPDPNKRYYFGIDVAGVGDDKTVLTIMDQMGKVHLIYECKSGDLVIQSNELVPLILKYNASGYCEKNGIGQGLYDLLNHAHTKVVCWDTSNKNKQKLVTGLKLNISKNELELPIERLCPELENEMSTFVSKRTSTGLITYCAEKGLHDDYVFSLMFANKARQESLTSNSEYANYDDDEIPTLDNIIESDFSNFGNAGNNQW